MIALAVQIPIPLCPQLSPELGVRDCRLTRELGGLRKYRCQSCHIWHNEFRWRQLRAESTALLRRAHRDQRVKEVTCIACRRTHNWRQFGVSRPHSAHRPSRIPRGTDLGPYVTYDARKRMFSERQTVPKWDELATSCGKTALGVKNADSKSRSRGATKLRS